MKRAFGIILAVCFTFPFMARSQNEGIKPVSNPAPAEKSTMYQRTTREMALLNEQAPGSGTPCPAGLPSGTANCYLDQGWAPGRVMLADNSIMEDLQLRYDIYHQQLQYIQDKDTLAFAKPDEVKCFMLGTRHFIYIAYVIDDRQGKGFFEILVPGNCQLLLRRTIQYHGTPESNPDLKEEVYIRDCSYFVSMNNSVATQVKLNKKSILMTLKDKQEQVEQFIDQNKLKMNSSEQLVMVVDYYNSLH